MAVGPQAEMLSDGRRLHLHHGPIDLIIEAFGKKNEVKAAYLQAIDRFDDILEVLVSELEALRRSLSEPRWQPLGPVAQRMIAACWPHRDNFITPMAAVAGAVADEILVALVQDRMLDRAYVNNGGDIAFFLSPGNSLTVGLVGDYHLPAIDASCALTHDLPVRGMATSGWKGRSYSLGIADAVTVLAQNAAAADAAATLIANSVTTDDPAIERVSARNIDPDSDLHDLLVTTNVGLLDGSIVDAALSSGVEVAERMCRGGHIATAVLVLRQEFRVVGSMPNELIECDAA